MILEGEFEYETCDKAKDKRRGGGGGGLGGHQKEFDVRKLLFSRKKATIDDRRRVIVSEEKRLKMYQDKRSALLMRHFKPQHLILQKGSFFGEEYIFADERCVGTRPGFAASMDKLVTREICFHLACKSLDGLLMSLSVDEFIRMLNTSNKEDNTLKRLRNQFIAKTKIKTDKILEDNQGESDSGGDSEGEI